MIIDGHNHLGYRIGGVQTSEEIIEKMDLAEVNKAIVFPWVETIDNIYIYNSVKKYPERLLGFCCINPWEKNSLDVLKKCRYDLNLLGLKLHPALHGYHLSNHSLVDKIFEFCVQNKMPIISHGGAELFNNPYEFEEMAKCYPEVILIIAHMGSIWATAQAREVAKRNKNIYLCTSWALLDDIKKAIKEVGAEQILLGSDSPASDYSLEIMKVKLATSHKRDQELILGRNIAKLLNLD